MNEDSSAFLEVFFKYNTCNIALLRQGFIELIQVFGQQPVLDYLFTLWQEDNMENRTIGFLILNDLLKIADQEGMTDISQKIQTGLESKLREDNDLDPKLKTFFAAPVS